MSARLTDRDRLMRSISEAAFQALQAQNAALVAALETIIGFVDCPELCLDGWHCEPCGVGVALAALASVKGAGE